MRKYFPRDYDDPFAAKAGIKEFIDCYIYERPHEALGQVTQQQKYVEVTEETKKRRKKLNSVLSPMTYLSLRSSPAPHPLPGNRFNPIKPNNRPNPGSRVRDGELVEKSTFMN